MKNGDGQAVHLLLKEHFIGEVQNMRCTASETSKLKNLSWRSEVAFPFEKRLTQMNQGMKELEDAGLPCYPQKNAPFLLNNI